MRVLKTAREFYEKVHLTLETPRVTSRQKHRSNVPATSMDEYFRLALFLPFIDNFLVQHKDRFNNHERTLELPSALLPKNVAEEEKEPDLDKIGNLYGNSFP